MYNLTSDEMAIVVSMATVDVAAAVRLTESSRMSLELKTHVTQGLLKAPDNPKQAVDFMEKEVQHVDSEEARHFTLVIDHVRQRNDHVR